MNSLKRYFCSRALAAEFLLLGWQQQQPGTRSSYLGIISFLLGKQIYRMTLRW